MFSTSGDILNWVLGICVIVLTFFLCWAIYYFVVATHKFFKVVKRVENGVEKAENVLDMAQDKIKNSATYMMMIGEVAKQILGFIKDKKDSPKRSRSKK